MFVHKYNMAGLVGAVVCVVVVIVVVIGVAFVLIGVVFVIRVVAAVVVGILMTWWLSLAIVTIPAMHVAMNITNQTIIL